MLPHSHEPHPGAEPHSVITAEVITDLPAFHQLAEEWDCLLLDSRSSTPFLTFAWLSAWTHHHLGEGALHVIVVRERGCLIGLAPMMRAYRGLTLGERLEFLGTGTAGSDYLDLILRRGFEADALSAIAGTIHALQLPLFCDHLPPDANAVALQIALAELGWTSLESTPDVCPYVDLSAGTWDAFLQTLGAAHRANIRRRLRALQRDFDVSFEPVTTDAERRRALARLARWNRVRWRDDGGTTAFPNRTSMAFHDDATRQAAEDGWLRLYTVTLNGRVEAVMYGFVIGKTFYFYQHGFNPDYSRYSLGLVLMALTIRSAIEDGLREFDMLYGHEAYKTLWARHDRALMRLELFPPRIGGTLLRRQAETRRVLRSIVGHLGLR